MDITFLISCIKYPQEHFNIFNHVQFVASKTRHSSCFKLKCLLPQSTSNHLNFIYFNRVVKLWNALPVIDPELSISTLKCNLRSYFWQYFLNNFNSDHPCTWHYTCPCNTCFSQPCHKTTLTYLAASRAYWYAFSTLPFTSHFH